MRLFWIDQTVQEEDFKAKNVKVWDEWFEGGNLKRSYAYQFESLRNQSDFGGRALTTVKQILVECKRRYSFTTSRNSESLMDGYKNLTAKEVNALYDIYTDIVDYIKQAPFRFLYKYYYHMDVSWHTFERFLDDVYYIPQFFLAKEDGFHNWVLSPHYFATNYFSKYTLVWLKKEQEHLMVRDCTRYFDYVYHERKLIRGNNKYYIIYKDDELRDDLRREELSRNQVVELLNEIKNNPSSRRLGTSFWNWSDVKKKVLQECAWATQWRVVNDRLDLILIQRSADVGLGLPFNWIQYYLLQSMIAHVSGLKVGRFVHQVGDVHYYDRHEDVLLEQIKTPVSTNDIEIKINKDVTSFFNFVDGDIEIVGYTPNKAVAMEVAI